MAYPSLCMPPEADLWPPDNRALASCLTRGEPGAFDEVVRLYGPGVQQLARRLLAWNKGQAEDVAQEVFVQVYLKSRQFRGDSALKTWLTRITINRCRSLQRRKLLGLAGLWSAIGRRPANEALGEREELANNIRAAVGRLPAREREVVVLYYLEEISAEEVARTLNLSASAVNVRLHRARAHLAPLLADLKGACDG